MKCIMLIAILVLLQILKFSDSQTIHVCTSTKGQQCHLDCETPDQSVSVTFTNPQPTAVGSCLASGTCGSGVPGYSVNQVNSTFTRLTIATLDYTRDYGNWSCSYGGTQSPLALLPCPSPSTTINITKEADNITCSSKCQFPVSAYSSLSLEYTQNGKVVSLVSGALPVSKNVTTDGCDSHETNVILQYQLKESEICGDVQFKCTFVNTYLGSNNGSLQHSFSACPTVAQYDYNWHILIGWIIGILIIPIAGFVFFMFQFVMKKHSGGSDKKCDGKFKKFGILVGAVLGGGALLALIICIIIATQVCLSQLGDAIGIGIGVSFGIMFMCVIIIVIVYFTCMKEKPDGDDSKPTTDKSEEINGKNNQIAPEKNESNKPNKKAATFNNAKPIMQDKPKNKALDDVPKGRQLPSPRKDDEENKIRMPRSLPPINHEENSTSSPKKKKKKRKSKENENEDKSE